MSEKHVIAAKKRWAGVSKKERSKRMSALVSGRHDNSTPAQKKKIGKLLTKARLEK